MLHFALRALGFGLLGLIVECLFTGIKSFVGKNPHGTCTTYLVMIPVYASAGLALEGIKTNLFWPLPVLAILYTITIMVSEFVWGYGLAILTDRCPWEYGRCKYTILGYVRADYFFFWYFLALLFNPLSTLLGKFVSLLVSA